MPSPRNTLRHSFSFQKRRWGSVPYVRWFFSQPVLDPGPFIKGGARSVPRIDSHHPPVPSIIQAKMSCTDTGESVRQFVIGGDETKQKQKKISCRFLSGKRPSKILARNFGRGILVRRRRWSLLPHLVRKRPARRARARQARVVMNPDTIWQHMAISSATAALRGFLDDLDGLALSAPSFLSFIPSLSFHVCPVGRRHVDPVLVGSSLPSSIVVARVMYL
ncbi:hypothetical protein EDB84DRAFT_269288 [Lactarius hengduanensis]|nr:hypothetical protein EDB84DRAFT_269288 [Lactarius hengduanensis]